MRLENIRFPKIPGSNCFNFSQIFVAAKLMIFVELSSKLSCIRTSLISLNCIKLSKKYIKNLNEIRSHDIVCVSLRSSSFKMQPRPCQFYHFNAYRLAPRLKPPMITSGDTLGLLITFPPVVTGGTPVKHRWKFFKNSKTNFENSNHALEHAGR